VCLRELREICGWGKTIPRSCILPGPHPVTPKWPFASRGYYDMYEGFHNDSKVCVQRLRIYSNDVEENVKRVRCWSYYHLFPLAFLTRSTGVLSGGHTVETPGASEYRSPYRCYCQSVSSAFALDDRRRTVRLHWQAPVCRQAQSCKFPPH